MWSSLPAVRDFYPRPPRGGRLNNHRRTVTSLIFLSTPSARRATESSKVSRTYSQISIHALREEGDSPSLHPSWRGGNFYPRPPRGGRQCQNSYLLIFSLISIHALREEGDLVSGYQAVALEKHFYPRPPRGGRHSIAWRLNSIQFISIHALREEGDSPGGGVSAKAAYFYPRPPRGGQPCSTSASFHLGSNFYPRPPRGGRPLAFHGKPFPTYISIHALREEGDSNGLLNVGGQAISIHALREEGDFEHSRHDGRRADFYPRPPRGGRRMDKVKFFNQQLFLSTPSARRATTDKKLKTQISCYFYPRPPRGGRREYYSTEFSNRKFLSTPSARRATSCVRQAHPAGGYFYPRPPRGGRLGDAVSATGGGNISIHALREEGDAWTKLNSSTSSYFYPRPPRGGRLPIKS